MNQQEQDKQANQVTDDATAQDAIPAHPTALSDQDLDKVAGGAIGTVTITVDKRAAPTFTITRAP